jgi:hypothetical protein
MMNATLAAMYNTAGYGAQTREQEKVAHLELFAKTAAANGIDLTALSQGDRVALYNEFTQKLAEEGGEFPPKGEEHEEESEEEKKKREEKDKEEGSEEEKKEAQAQFAAMRQWQEKNAEVDFLGRRMAHAFEDERRQIQAAKTASAKPGAAQPAVPAVAPMPKTASVKQPATPFDTQAARLAVKLASDAKLNTNSVIDKLNALLTLGVPPLDKTASVASASDYTHTLNVRALELLEASGYPVNWNAVFGQ